MSASPYWMLRHACEKWTECGHPCWTFNQLVKPEGKVGSRRWKLWKVHQVGVSQLKRWLKVFCCDPVQIRHSCLIWFSSPHFFCCLRFVHKDAQGNHQRHNSRMHLFPSRVSLISCWQKTMAKAENDEWECMIMHKLDPWDPEKWTTTVPLAVAHMGLTMPREM